MPVSLTFGLSIMLVISSPTAGDSQAARGVTPSAETNIESIPGPDAGPKLEIIRSGTTARTKKIDLPLGETERASVQVVREDLFAEGTTNPWAIRTFWSGFALSAAGAGSIAVAMNIQRPLLNDGVLRTRESNQTNLTQGNLLMLGGEISAMTGVALMGVGTLLWSTGWGEVVEDTVPTTAWIQHDGDTLMVSAAWQL